MPNSDLNKKAEILKALGHRHRLQMVMGIYQDNCNVTRIVEKLDLPQSTVSQHLSILRRCGIIRGNRKGKQVCYEVINDFAIMIVKKLLSEQGKIDEEAA